MLWCLELENPTWRASKSIVLSAPLSLTRSDVEEESMILSLKQTESQPHRMIGFFTAGEPGEEALFTRLKEELAGLAPTAGGRRRQPGLRCVFQTFMFSIMPSTK